MQRDGGYGAMLATLLEATASAEDRETVTQSLATRAQMPVTVTGGRLSTPMTNARGGRPSKGPRELLGARAHVPLAEAARSRASELGFSTMNDYLVSLIAQDNSMPEYAPRPADPTRLELPIQAA